MTHNQHKFKQEIIHCLSTFIWKFHIYMQEKYRGYTELIRITVWRVNC